MRRVGSNIRAGFFWMESASPFDKLRVRLFFALILSLSKDEGDPT
jgi:hypothetical protein